MGRRRLASRTMRSTITRLAVMAAAALHHAVEGLRRVPMPRTIRADQVPASELPLHRRAEAPVALEDHRIDELGAFQVGVADAKPLASTRVCSTSRQSTGGSIGNRASDAIRPRSSVTGRRDGHRDGRAGEGRRRCRGRAGVRRSGCPAIRRSRPRAESMDLARWISRHDPAPHLVDLEVDGVRVGPRRVRTGSSGSPPARSPGPGPIPHANGAPPRRTPRHRGGTWRRATGTGQEQPRPPCPILTIVGGCSHLGGPDQPPHAGDPTTKETQNEHSRTRLHRHRTLVTFVMARVRRRRWERWPSAAPTACDCGSTSGHSEWRCPRPRKQRGSRSPAGRSPTPTRSTASSTTPGGGGGASAPHGGRAPARRHAGLVRTTDPSGFELESSPPPILDQCA